MEMNLELFSKDMLLESIHISVQMPGFFLFSFKSAKVFSFRITVVFN